MQRPALLALPSLLALVTLSALGACAGGPKPVAQAPMDIVLCPSGSTFHAAQNRCVASAPLAAPRPPEPLPLARADAGAPASPGGSEATVTVTCAFPNGWVATLPARLYPRDDEFIMQALIGFEDDPEFWQKQTEYAALFPFKAQRCNDRTTTTLEVPAGDHFVLAGEADTFAKRNGYSRNGMLRKVTLVKGQSVRMDITSRDLTRTWPCISCPWVHFVGEAGVTTEPFVVLARRASLAERGAERRRIRVPVVGGRVHLVLEEREREITHLDALTLLREGVALAPEMAQKGRFALAKDDGLEVILPPGTRIEVSFRVPEMDSGTLEVELVTTGYYEPLQ